ncbi:glycosyltransferase family 2 protein [Adlercreutzia sp. ZJ242]|uniref:glycosyltransferase family 2 protein n=1 Tax=Adlercreutzia sp. ZJ242 TaxID=2709409 RepID=UPI001F14E386|nr:glycosyltransferase family 2 protein [Adlercreutzia sp. ZJ242]
MIVPVYNGEAYLSECLDSVVSQAFQDYEIVVVDDGSTDNTASICRLYSSRDARIRVVSQSNQGLLIARRIGLLESKGDYVLFVDSDDCIRVDTLQVCSDAIDEHGFDIVVFGMIRGVSRSCIGGIALGQIKASACGIDRFRCGVLRGKTNSLCGKAIRRSIIDISVSYEDYRGMMHGEDLLQLLPIADCAKKCGYIAEGLYLYRVNDQSSTACYKDSQLDDLETLFPRLIEYGQKWGHLIDAQVGIFVQYVTLAKILYLSKNNRKKRADSLGKMSESLVNQRFNGNTEALSALRIDNRLLIGAILRKRDSLCFVIVRVVKWVKQIRRLRR